MIRSLLKSPSLFQAFNSQVKTSIVGLNQANISSDQFRFQSTESQGEKKDINVTIPSIPSPKYAYRASYPLINNKKAYNAPWEPSRFLYQKKHIKHRMKFLLNVLDEERYAEFLKQRSYPNFKVGDVLDVTMVAPESERKAYLHRGLCVQKIDNGIRSSFKIYCVFTDSGGFIQHIPLCMPDLLDIKIVGEVKYKDDEDLMELVTNESRECRFLDKIVKI